MSGDAALYDRLGGREAIDAVVDDFYDRVLDDERIAHHFAEADVDALRRHQKLFVESVAGGPREYDGREMAEAHADLAITDEDFDVVVEHLSGALADAGVAEADREALLSDVAALRPAIVTA